MLYSIKLSNRYKLDFSDTYFKPFRKKPTIAIYDAKENTETKIASFNNQETFEWFINLLSSLKENEK